MGMTPNYGKNPYFNLPKEEIAKLVKVSPYGTDGKPESSVAELLYDGSYYLRYRIKSRDGLRTSQWSSVHNVSFPQGPDGKVSTIYEMNGLQTPTIRTDLHSVNLGGKSEIESSISRVTPGADVLTYTWQEPRFLPSQYFDVFLSWQEVYKIDSATANVSAATALTHPIYGAGFRVEVSNLQDISQVKIGDEFACVNGTRTQPVASRMFITAKYIETPGSSSIEVWAASTTNPWGGTNGGTISNISGIRSWENSPWEFAGTTSSTSFSFKQRTTSYAVTALVRSACFPKTLLPEIDPVTRQPLPYFDRTTFLSMSQKYSTYQNVAGTIATSTAGGVGFVSTVTNLSLPFPGIEYQGEQMFNAGSVIGLGRPYVHSYSLLSKNQIVLTSSASMASASTNVTSLRF